MINDVSLHLRKQLSHNQEIVHNVEKQGYKKIYDCIPFYQSNLLFDLRIKLGIESYKDCLLSTRLSKAPAFTKPSN